MSTPMPAVPITINISNRGSIERDLMRFTGTRIIGVEFTSVCNLRCVYCDVSAPTHQGRHTDEDLLRTALDLIRLLHSQFMNFTGIGELTTIPDWPKVIAPFLAIPSLHKMLTTNLQKQMDEDELVALAKFDQISVSIDTADPKLLREIRRKSELRNITTNMMMLRAHCIQHGKRIPSFKLNVVVTDRSALTILRLAAFAVACGIDEVMLIELNDTEFFIDRSVVRHVSALNDNEFAEFVHQLSEAEKLLQQHGKQLAATGDLKRHIQMRQSGSSEFALKPGETRRCTLLWDYAVIKDDGRISHCCGNLMSTKSLRQHSFEEIVNDDEIQGWRAALLTGENLPSACVNCHWAMPTSPQELLQCIGQSAAEAHVRGAPLSDTTKPIRLAATGT